MQAASVNRAFVEIVDVQLFVGSVILSRYQGEGAYMLIVNCTGKIILGN